MDNIPGWFTDLKGALDMGNYVAGKGEHPIRVISQKTSKLLYSIWPWKIKVRDALLNINVRNFLSFKSKLRLGLFF